MSSQRIYLSPPFISNDEFEEVKKAIASGWIAPQGPSIDEFEKKLSLNYVNRSVLALNSGTSALHLALILAGVADGDEILVSSFTFAACANVILYERAIPIFLDSEGSSWNLDPLILEDYLSKVDKPPKVLIVTHLYGMPAQINQIISIAHQYGVKVIEDAAEALGARIDGIDVGGLGDYGVLSFNGNKIITTSSGGALICSNDDWKRGKHLATQANSGAYEYDHSEAGFNYRMSNVLAGIGIAQYASLELFIKKKRSIFNIYQQELANYFDFPAEPEGTFSNRWLSTALIKDKSTDIVELIKYLNGRNIESRRLWKPLHLHEAYDNAVFLGSGVCEQIFARGICLPSGTGLTESEQDFVIKSVKNWCNQ